MHRIELFHFLLMVTDFPSAGRTHLMNTVEAGLTVWHYCCKIVGFHQATSMKNRKNRGGGMRLDNLKFARADITCTCAQSQASLL